MNRYTPTKEDIMLLKREDIMLLDIIPLQETCLDLFDETKQKDKEIERLNNIINKAKEYIKSIEYEDGFTNKMVYYDEDETCIDLLNILQGSDTNE